MAIATFEILTSTNNPKYHDLTDNWQAKPIVDIISVPAENSRCPSGYERLFLDSFAIKEIKGGPCVCNEKVYGFQSSPAECSKAALANGCDNALFSHRILPQSWRGVNFCFLRSVQAAAAWRPYDDNGYYINAPRPYPDRSGGCPSRYHRCGKTSQYEDGAVCVPEKTLCPITNLQIASKTTVPRIRDGWEPAGALQNGSFQLYLRREGAGELPIVDIGLAFNAQHGHSQTGGPCLQSRDAVVTLNANAERPWAYDAALPLQCDRIDTRYQLLDKLPLQEYYLQQLQSEDPSCAAYSVLPLTDSKYTAAGDPDYANSGAACQAPTLQSCFLDGATTGTCSANDAICDVAVNQNTCGAYAHAIRSAFADTTVSLGLYFRREIPWSQSCPVQRVSVSDLHDTYNSEVVFAMGCGLFSTSLGLLVNGVLLVCHVYHKPGAGYRLNTGFEREYAVSSIMWKSPSLLFYVATWICLSYFCAAHRAVLGESCTDAFTESLFQYPASLTVCSYLLGGLCFVEALLWVVAFLRCAILNTTHPKVREDALAAARNDLYDPPPSDSREIALVVPAQASATEVVPAKMMSTAEPAQTPAAIPIVAPVPATGVVAATRATAHRLGRSLRQQLRTATGATSHAYQPLQGEDYEDADVDCDGSNSGDVELRTVVASIV